MTSAPLWLRIVLLAVALWCGFWLLQAVLLAPCAASCSTVADYATHDPLCLADPTCVSPFYRPDQPGVQDWTGLRAWRLESYQLPPPSSRSLAPLNYVFFMGIMVPAVAFAARRARRSTGSNMALATLLVWAGLEIGSWFLTAAWSDTTLNAMVLVEGAITLLVSFSILGLTVYIASGRTRTRIARSQPYRR